MREDMFKVIVERPRRGGSWMRHHPSPLNEDAPAREPMSRGRGTKYLNENLAPLARWFRRQVGRPWDHVYSELSLGLNVRSAVQQHVRDHVKDLVALHVVERDGELFANRWGDLRSILAFRNEALYVCPRTGLLRLARRAGRRPRVRAPPPPPLARWMDASRAHIKLSGSWFEVTAARIPRDTAAWDVALRRYLPADVSERNALLRTTYGRTDVYGVAKRQLSRAELKKENLR